MEGPTITPHHGSARLTRATRMESPPQNRTLVRMLIRISAVVLRTLGLTGCKLLGSGRSYLGGIGCMLTDSNCLHGLIMMVEGWCRNPF